MEYFSSCTAYRVDDMKGVASLFSVAVRTFPRFSEWGYDGVLILLLVSGKTFKPYLIFIFLVQPMS